MPDRGRRKWFYIWLVPVLWMTGVAWGFRHPGDEYALWVISAMPGAWVGWVMPNVGDIHGVVPVAVLGGGLVMAGVGWVMDRLRVPFRPWIGGVLLGAVGICFQTLAEYPTLERAVGKNGSLMAYVLFSWNVALVLACAFGMVITGFMRVLWWRRKA